MGQRLANKVALITGGTSGIGEATAELFAAEGAKVVITGRSDEKGANIASRLGENVAFQHADVTEERDIEASVNFTVERFGKLDVLFNNAGGSVGRETLEQISQQHIDYAVRLLLSSVILGVRYAVEPMKANGGGVILNNSSIAGLRYGHGGPLYSTLKAAVTHYTKFAGVELGPFGIRVNAISPGMVATPIFWADSERTKTVTNEQYALNMKVKDALAKLTTLSNAGLAEDVAQAALYLASDSGKFVNCIDLVVDGGRSAMFNEKAEE